MHIFHDPSSVHPGTQFPTLAKAAWIAEFLARAPVDAVDLMVPTPATRAQLERVHTSDYLDEIVHGGSAVTSNGLDWDEHVWTSVTASTGGVIAAVLEAYRSGGISGALAAGLHHARADRAAGYCTINGIVVAIREVLGHGARRVLVLDVDAHCGGGTASLIVGLEGVEQVDISVNSYDRYPSTRQSRLVIVDQVGVDGRTYLAAIEEALAAIEDPSSIDVMILNAGVDPHEDAGGVSGITAQVLAAREAMIFDWANRHGVPVAWVLAGGYTVAIEKAELVELHMQTIRAAATAEAIRRGATD